MNSRIHITNLKKGISFRTECLNKKINAIRSEFQQFFNGFTAELNGYFTKLANDNQPGKEIDRQILQLTQLYDSSKFNVDNNPKKLRNFAKEFLRTKEFIENFEFGDERVIIRQFEDRFKFMRNRLADILVKLQKNIFDDPNLYEQVVYEETKNLDYCTLKNHYEEAIRESILSLSQGTNLTIPQFNEPTLPQFFEHTKARLSNNLYDDYYVNKAIEEEEIEEICNEPIEKEEVMDVHDGMIMPKPVSVPINAFDRSVVVLTAKEKDFLFKNLFDNVPNYRLMFRASAVDFNPFKFHEACDRRGPTLVVARSENYLFGGYVDKSWESPDKWSFKSTPNAVIFSVTNNQIYKQRSEINSKSILCRKDSGPCFGMKELALTYEGRVSANFSHVGMEYGEGCDFYCFRSLTKKTLFDIKDYEVYSVSFEVKN